jgi:hypothetical protein
MSTSLGIYIECEKIYKNKKNIIHGCEKCKSEIYNGNKFCTDCGSPIKEYYKNINDYNDFYEELNEIFDGDILILNGGNDDIIENNKIIYYLNGINEYSNSLETGILNLQNYN